MLNNQRVNEKKQADCIGPGGLGGIVAAFIWMKYNDFTATSLEWWLIDELIGLSIPKMTSFQVGELSYFIQMDVCSGKLMFLVGGACCPSDSFA